MNLVNLSMLESFQFWKLEVISYLQAMASMNLGSSGELSEHDSFVNLLGAGFNHQHLLEMPVSLRSKFGDALWDFNLDYPNVARDLRGVAQYINFNQFSNIPPLIMMEFKAGFLNYFWIPQELGISAGKSRLKISSVIQVFKRGLSFVDALYEECSAKYGRVFVNDNFLGLKDIEAEHYTKASEKFDNTYDGTIDTFFTVVRSPFLAERVFGGKVPFVDIANLPWKKLGSRKYEAQERPRLVLPNLVFEKASLVASLNIVDFLDTLSEKVIDEQSLRRRNEKGHGLAQVYGLSRRTFDLYVINRLRLAGYSTVDIASNLYEVLPEFWSRRIPDQFVERGAANKMSDVDLDKEFLEYIMYMHESACYIIAQYTGMRPSELSEVKAESCIRDLNGHYVIGSHVLKHQDLISKLFDDWWIAIPIVRDAISVVKILARITRNSYVFSSMKAVPPGGVSLAHGSVGLSNMMARFFGRFLGGEQLEALLQYYTPYTLRHTLAYQLFRADVGLPFISHQLKHFKSNIGDIDPNKSFSSVTLGYGEIGLKLAAGKSKTSPMAQALHREAALESIKAQFDPDGSYAGIQAKKHVEGIQKFFQGHMEAGYSKDEIFEQMAEQGFGIINVGAGFCYGNETEEFDETVPCLGSLRCNPVRCQNAIVTKVHIGRWHEVRKQNKKSLSNPSSMYNRAQILAAIDEAESVLMHLGEDID
ncbi:tyrosine-type recombinase/integrase [Pseudomonas sp. DSV-1]|uniref:tyrosine-type recombinase/integrase n=1 Tax=Pseudomonas sp. DSV-1 TaxID=3112250 RepID=UPI002DBFC742|nr:tyrosine-type recombinase/integrase [Pseudomonas sp. DSV-1]MEC4239521.1 tyrosine-type recombinase/integrase [Pseudomonas sp. DSV-1]